MLLSPGIHSFPFKLGLPLGLPSTFLGKHGWVQYYCKAVSILNLYIVISPVVNIFFLYVCHLWLAGLSRAGWIAAQEPAGFYRYEPDRFESGTTNFSCKYISNVVLVEICVGREWEVALLLWSTECRIVVLIK